MKFHYPSKLFIRFYHSRQFIKPSITGMMIPVSNRFPSNTSNETLSIIALTSCFGIGSYLLIRNLHVCIDLF